MLLTVFGAVLLLLGFFLFLLLCLAWVHKPNLTIREFIKELLMAAAERIRK